MPTIEIIEPSGRKTSYKPSERLTCEVRLTIPEGGDLPVFLKASYRDSKGSDGGDASLKPLKKDGEAFIMSGELSTPHAPGRYRLEIEATYVKYTASAGAKPAHGSPTEFVSKVVSGGSISIK